MHIYSAPPPLTLFFKNIYLISWAIYLYTISGGGGGGGGGGGSHDVKSEVVCFSFY